MNKRVMVDMSATLIHHGHVRLIKKAAEYGDVIVGLTSDEEILKKKLYDPEIAFEFRKEILESIKYVSEVVTTPWLITNETLKQYDIDLLIHGDDNSNNIDKDKLLVFPRTEDISSTEIRKRSAENIVNINNQKLMLTPGPAVVLHENLFSIKPLFGRGDAEYLQMLNKVSDWIKELSGQDELVISQGSSTFSLELAAHTFIQGKVLIISTGYYSDRLEKLLPKGCEITLSSVEEYQNIEESFDWVMCAYTETSIAFKTNLTEIRAFTDRVNGKLFVDATGSIGLEEGHHLADLMAFSSCKGLFGITGASFIAHKFNLLPNDNSYFYFNLETHKNKMVTGPYHAIASLYGVMDIHDKLRQRVKNSKNLVLDEFPSLVRDKNQPLLCTYIEGNVVSKDQNVVLYSPRSELTGSVLCHLGEIHYDELNILNRISVEITDSRQTN